MSFKAIFLVSGLSCLVCSTYSKGLCESQMSATPPDPSTECCGIQACSSDAIIHDGPNAVLDQYPWVVLIEYLNKNNVAKTPCHGVLISGQYVLTVGHCVTGVGTVGKPSNIILGDYDTTHEGPDCEPQPGGGVDCTEGETKIPIEAVLVHPEFNINSVPTNDIALIKMKSAAPYTDFIRPICLPTEDITQKSGETNLTESSWGALDNDQTGNSKKQFVTIPYVPQNACSKAFAHKFALDQSHLCAGGYGNKAFCKASSGAALMYENNIINELVGLSSFSSYPCNQDMPTVYTNVYKYVSWIKNTISA